MEDALQSIKKRNRADEFLEFDESKRLRHLDFEYDDVDIDDVIRSLEQEIASTATVTTDVKGSPPPQPDLGYLQQASDDELGLPPAVGSSTDGGDVIDIVDDEDSEVAEVLDVDRMWGFEEEMSKSPYGGLEFGFGTEFDDGVIFNGGLFDCSSYVDFGPLDYDFS